MSASNLSSEQMAEHVAKEGGGSFHWNTGRPVGGKGFMLALEGGEHTTDGPVTAADINEHKETHQDLAETLKTPVHGVWGQTLDVSTKVPSMKQAREKGVAERQEAVYALPETNLGAGVKATGQDVFLHTGDIGQNDVDPAFRPGKRKFSKNEYDNPAWQESSPSGAQMPVRDPESGKMIELHDLKTGHSRPVTAPVTYGDVLRTINRGRTERLRKGAK